MKKTLCFIKLFVTLFFISACSSNSSSLELIDADVQIVHDEALVGSIGIMEGERKGEFLVPTALYYEFTIKNKDNKPIGNDQSFEKGIELTIKPKEELKSVSEEVIGFNIYNFEEYDETELGHGVTFTTMLHPNEEGVYTLHYDLGVSEENPTVPLIVPSEDKLELLLENALNAFLVVTIENKEIARFDLEEYQN